MEILLKDFFYKYRVPSIHHRRHFFKMNQHISCLLIYHMIMVSGCPNIIFIT